MPVPPLSVTVPGPAASCQSTEQVWVSLTSGSEKSALSCTVELTATTAPLAGAVIATAGRLLLPTGGGPAWIGTFGAPASFGASGDSVPLQAAKPRTIHPTTTFEPTFGPPRIAPEICLTLLPA